MAEQFVSVDPVTGRILWSHVITSGYVPPLADVQRDNPGQTILKIPHMPALHAAEQMHTWSIDPVAKVAQQHTDDPKDAGLPVKDRPVAGAAIALPDVVDVP